MNLPYLRAPHVEGVQPKSLAPNAALLIDFDNVTMGMRSDLSKELKNLLSTDVIKGKVTVQRAYADWRRYPQYIVPLSEASVDLIFAPAYGSSKKNATDIRMAIDAIELVFVRPEIGTFILLTGDSDFSSLVLKLKEYGKYVIGVGIQESSSDILVQNCDEYYSYTSLTGLTKTSDASGKPTDPWALVEQAVKKMVQRGDVMRSDRLKQVMIEIDGNFAEKNFGFSKFSKFMAEAASRRLIRLHKLDNGQYEIMPAKKGGGRDRGRDRDRDRDKKDDGRRRGRRGRNDRSTESRDSAAKASDEAAVASSEADAGDDDPLEGAYQTLAKALELHAEAGRDEVRDSDVKRKILEVAPGFDEGELGFGKFSRFLKQAVEHGVVTLRRLESGNQVVRLADGKASGKGRLAPEPGTEAPQEETRWELVAGKGTRSFRSLDDDNDDNARDARQDDSGSGRRTRAPSRSRTESEAATPSEPSEDTPAPDTPADDTREEPEASGAAVIEVKPEVRGHGRRPTTRRGGGDGGVVLLEGQIIGSSSASPTPSTPADQSGAGSLDLAELGLPRDGDAIVQYLTNSYKGIGQKTAEQVVEAFGSQVFDVFQTQPERVRSTVPRRAESLLEAWTADYARRVGGESEAEAPSSDAAPEGRSGGLFWDNEDSSGE